MLWEAWLMWEVLFDEECEAWVLGLDPDLRRAVFDRIALVETWGPQLGRPHVDTLKGTSLPNLKELRVPHGGEPWRILFAFDPVRRAVFLVGGCKAGDKRWYKRWIPIAEERYRRHFERGE